MANTPNIMVGDDISVLAGNLINNDLNGNLTISGNLVVQGSITGSSAGGSNGTVQYNNNGAFAGDTDLMFVSSAPGTGQLFVGGNGGAGDAQQSYLFGSTTQIALVGAAGNATNPDGAGVRIRAGDANAIAGVHTGGNLTLQPGGGANGGAGGTLTLTGAGNAPINIATASASSTFPGGQLSLSTGAGASLYAAGNIVLTAGTHGTASRRGKVIINTGGGDQITVDGIGTIGIGISTGLIGFYGVTPVIQQSAAAVVTVADLVTLLINTGIIKA